MKTIFWPNPPATVTRRNISSSSPPHPQYSLLFWIKHFYNLTFYFIARNDILPVTINGRKVLLLKLSYSAKYFSVGESIVKLVDCNRIMLYEVGSFSRLNKKPKNVRLNPALYQELYLPVVRCSCWIRNGRCVTS